MDRIHRPIDFARDRAYILERHCHVNYACESPWAREIPYADDRAERFSLTSQVNGCYRHLAQAAEDERTVAEIPETEDGQTIGDLWAPFFEDRESGFSFAEVQDICIEDAYRRLGLASELLRYVEAKARRHGAKALRSGTGCVNISSIQHHEKPGSAPYRYEFEKLLYV